MANALKRLLLFAPRRAEQEPAPAEPTARVDPDAMPLEAAMSRSSSTLQPAAIFRQVLFNPTEFTPAWLRPRPAATPDRTSSSGSPTGEAVVARSAPIDEPKPAKRGRRPKAAASPAPAAARTRSKRTAKPKAGPSGD
jgi:hypothetical protein